MKNQSHVFSTKYFKPSSLICFTSIPSDVFWRPRMVYFILSKLGYLQRNSKIASGEVSCSANSTKNCKNSLSQKYSASYFFCRLLNWIYELKIFKITWIFNIKWCKICELVICIIWIQHISFNLLPQIKSHMQVGRCKTCVGRVQEWKSLWKMSKR